MKITLPAADFTNSRNEVAQLTAWIAKLEHHGIIQLLRKLYDYGNGSLFVSMWMWCLAAEGFDPTADNGIVKIGSYSAPVQICE